MRIGWLDRLRSTASDRPAALSFYSWRIQKPDCIAFDDGLIVYAWSMPKSKKKKARPYEMQHD
jgi:hypothetical protein